MPALDLRRAAYGFAAELTNLLNNTVTHGVRITAVIEPNRSIAKVGYRIKADDLVPQAGIPLTLGASSPRGYLLLYYRLRADDERIYLAVQSSVMGLCADAELETPLMHYDYERDKGDGYPEAHLQIEAEATAWTQLRVRCARDSDPLNKLHFPVGGRRYRPTLEDVIEFLACERLAATRPDWQQRVEEGRERFRKKQLRAAVRRDPETAREALADHG